MKLPIFLQAIPCTWTIWTQKAGWDRDSFKEWGKNKSQGQCSWCEAGAQKSCWWYQDRNAFGKHFPREDAHLSLATIHVKKWDLRTYLLWSHKLLGVWLHVPDVSYRKNQVFQGFQTWVTPWQRLRLRSFFHSPGVMQAVSAETATSK